MYTLLINAPAHARSVSRCRLATSRSGTGSRSILSTAIGSAVVAITIRRRFDFASTAVWYGHSSVSTDAVCAVQPVDSVLVLPRTPDDISATGHAASPVRPRGTVCLLTVNCIYIIYVQAPAPDSLLHYALAKLRRSVL